MKSDDDFKPKPQVEEGISNVYLLNKDNVNDFLEKTYSSIRLSLENEILDILMAKG